MTNEVPERELADTFIGEGPAGDESPEEYMSNDQSAAVSPDTGTVYDEQGEPEVTPHDLEDEDEEDET
jgi:hypothetical protein